LRANEPVLRTGSMTSKYLETEMLGRVISVKMQRNDSSEELVWVRTVVYRIDDTGGYKVKPDGRCRYVARLNVNNYTTDADQCGWVASTEKVSLPYHKF
jgi:hypothetical protein